MATQQQIAKKLTPEELESQIVLLDGAVKEYAIADTFTQAGSLSQTLRLAKGMQQLRTLLTKDVVDEMLMPLRGSKLGFLTDRDKDPEPERYSWDVVRDVSIEAFIRGFQPVGNEFNLIAGGFYAAKNGIARKLREYPKLTDLEPRPGRVVISNDGESALVAFTIKYKLDGVARELARDAVRDVKDPNLVVSDQRVQVRVNKRMGYDGILGKAHRKAMALLLDHLTGSTLSLPVADIGDDEAITTSAEPSPTNGEAKEPAKSAQEAALQDVINKHKPAGNGAPTPAEAAADERANSGK